MCYLISVEVVGVMVGFSGVKGLIGSGRRIFSPQKSKGMGESELLASLNTIGGMSFDSLDDFFKYYKTDAWDYAYQNLDPYTSFQLALSSWSVSAAMLAITMPLAAAEIVPMPKDPQNPNYGEMLYLKTLFERPNPIDSGFDFQYKIALDLLAPGGTYIEVSYNDYGFPAALYRIPPYDISPKRASDGSVVFVRKSTGFVFNKNNLIPIFNHNPYSDYKPFSPLVPLFGKLMLDQSVLRHNFDFFTNQSLKGIISLSDKISASAAGDETNRMQEQIKHMKNTGDSGHLVLYGATYQAIGATNRDMLVPEVEKSVLNAVAGVYHVPPAKIMQIDSGNIGSGTGQSQDDSMNETLMHHGRKIITSLNSTILELAGIRDTSLTYKNLTKTDEKRKAELNEVLVRSGQKVLNEVRVEAGDAPYNNEHANEPWMPINHLPLSLVDNQKQVNGQNALLESMRQFDKKLGVVLDED